MFSVLPVWNSILEAWIRDDTVGHEMKLVYTLTFFNKLPAAIRGAFLISIPAGQAPSSHGIVRTENIIVHYFSPL
jgi:hypothetical protein